MRFKKIGFIILCIFILLPCFCRAQQTVEKPYDWYAEEKLTISSTVVQLSSEEYNYNYGATRINVSDANSIAWIRTEIVTDATTGAMGILDNCDDCNSASWLDINIKYNGLDSADFDPNDKLQGGTSGAAALVTGTYTRGTASKVLATVKSPWIAEIHVLDNSIIWTCNGATPVYSATDSLCFGEKQYEGDTFYLFGPRQIENFKAVRASGSDAIIYPRYGR